MMRQMEAASTAEHYRELDDDALLRIAADRKDLTPEAAMALDAELSSRHLGHSQVEQVISDDKRYDQEEARRNPPIKRGPRHSGAFGSEYYGSKNVQQRMTAEIYTATLFLAILWFPLIPLGTYRLIHASSEHWWWRSDPKVLEKLPLNWKQIRNIWAKALLIALAIYAVLRFAY